MGQILMVGAHGVFHRMLAGAGADGHHHTGKYIGKSQTLPRLFITAVPDGAGQIFSYVFYGRQRVHIAHQIGRGSDITLHAVKQCVKSLISRKQRRHGSHKLGIYHRHSRKQGGLASKSDLLIGFIVGDHAKSIHFAAGAGRGGDRYDGQRLFGQPLFLSRSPDHIVPEISVVDCHSRDGFCRVHHAAASQRHHQITAVFSGAGCAGHHRAFQRIGHNLIKQHPVDPRLLQLFLRPGQRSVFLDRFSGRDHQQRFFARQSLSGKGI